MASVTNNFTSFTINNILKSQSKETASDATGSSTIKSATSLTLISKEPCEQGETTEIENTADPHPRNTKTPDTTSQLPGRFLR